MRQYNCDAPGCSSPATAHYIRAESRIAVAEGHLCNEHGHAFLNYYQRAANVERAALRVANGIGSSFDPEILFFNDVGNNRGPVCRVFLVETGGTRRFSVTVGPCEGQSLRLELERFKAPRPLTHRAMVAAIEALGGELRYVVVDKFFPAREVAYEAKLNIQQSNLTHEVDARPSDAFVLAVIREVPIIVLHEVLAAIAEHDRS